MKPFTLIVLIFGSSLWSGCGYRLLDSAGRTAEPSSSAITIAIPIFENVTSEPALEGRLTEQITREFLTQGRWRIVNAPDRADLVLRGRVTLYDLTALSFDRTTLGVQEYRVRIGITARLENPRSGNLIWETSLVSTADYFVGGDTAKDRVARDRAAAEAGLRLADTLVTRLLSNP
jgi:hypothetical protein